MRQLVSILCWLTFVMSMTLAALTAIPIPGDGEPERMQKQTTAAAFGLGGLVLLYLSAVLDHESEDET